MHCWSTSNGEAAHTLGLSLILLHAPLEYTAHALGLSFSLFHAPLEYLGEMSMGADLDVNIGILKGHHVCCSRTRGTSNNISYLPCVQ